MLARHLMSHRAEENAPCVARTAALHALGDLIVRPDVVSRLRWRDLLSLRLTVFANGRTLNSSLWWRLVATPSTASYSTWSASIASPQVACDARAPDRNRLARSMGAAGIGLRSTHRLERRAAADRLETVIASGRRRQSVETATEGRQSSSWATERPLLRRRCCSARRDSRRAPEHPRARRMRRRTATHRVRGYPGRQSR